MEDSKKEYYAKLTTKELEVLAEQGDSWSQNNLGLCYEYGAGVRKNYKKAVEWFTKAAEQGVDMAQYHLALFYELGIGVESDLNKAFEWYTVSAKLGNPMAQNNLGQCYLNGFFVEKDLKKAKKWFTRAAKQGDPEAQKTLQDLFADDSLKDLSKQPNVEEPLSQELDMDVFKEFDENKDFNDFPF